MGRRRGRPGLTSTPPPGTVLALKQLPKASTTLRGFLYEFCVGLSLGSHAAIVAACGVGLESADSYSFLTEPVLHGDLIAYIRPKVGRPRSLELGGGGGGGAGGLARPPCSAWASGVTLRAA